MYLYVDNQPTISTDPSGLQSKMNAQCPQGLTRGMKKRLKKALKDQKIIRNDLSVTGVIKEPQPIGFVITVKVDVLGRSHTEITTFSGIILGHAQATEPRRRNRYRARP